MEAGSYIASGFIISACITLDDGWLSVLFYLAGEFALMVFSYLYQMSTSYDDERSIRSRNVASGLHWGLSLAALGLFLGRALQLSQSIVVFLVWFGLGTPILLAVTKIVNLVIFPTLNVEDELYTTPTPSDAVYNPVALRAGQMDPVDAGLAHRMRGGSVSEAVDGARLPAVSPRPPPVSSRPSVASMPAMAPPPSVASVLNGPAYPASATPPVEHVVQEAFKKYDHDNSGTLTKDECVELISGLNLNVTRQYLEGVWSVYDTNGDGTLDADEFAIFYVVLQKRSIAANAEGSPTSMRPTFEMEGKSSAAGAPARPGSVNYANYDEVAKQVQFVPSDEAAAAQGLYRTSAGDPDDIRVHNWGVALVVGALTISMAQLLNTFLRDCSFEFSVH